MTKLLKLGTTILATFALVACGESGGGQGNEHLEINQEQAQAKMQELAEGDGFYLKFNYSYSSTDNEGTDSSNGSMYYGMKGDVFWMGSEDFDIAVKESETKYDYYRKEEGAWKYSSSMTKAQAEEYGLEKSYQQMATSWFYWGNAYDGQLKKGKDTTIAGRKCYTYTFDYNSGADARVAAQLAAQGVGQVSVKYEIAVDKELGITMKVAISGESSEGAGSLSYEVTEFKTGSAVEVPVLPAAQLVNND